jgi:transcriptional regulator with XRE-family HTH domain
VSCSPILSINTGLNSYPAGAMEIGTRIKKYRKINGLTIKHLSDKVGITQSYISQLENDKVNPSLGTLKKIANALNINMINFFDCDREDDNIIVRKEERIDFGYPSGKFRSQLLASNIASKAMEPIYTIIDPGGDTIEPYKHGNIGEEFGVVIKGELLLDVEGTEYHLFEGDAFYFRSNRLHRYSNPSKITTEVVWVITPPTY